MRDHGNMPVLDWRVSKAPFKAKAQIVHESLSYCRCHVVSTRRLTVRIFPGWCTGAPG
jgi:hypothetical protein